MLRPYSDLPRFSLRALDGEIGDVKDAYFDDHAWTLRYLVVTTGGWLRGRTVLITPLSLRGVDWLDRRIEVDLTQEQIRNAPGSETDMPVSRRQEIAYFDYYGYPYYWAGDPLAMPGVGPMPVPPGTRGPTVQQTAAGPQRMGLTEGDPNLRSAKEVHGYHIEATDDSIGHVGDFLFDDESWALRFFVVDTRRWLPGRHVLISTDWIENVSWESRSVKVAMTREEVRNSPDFDHQLFSEEDEEALYRHYGRTRPGRVQVQIR